MKPVIEAIYSFILALAREGVSESPDIELPTQVFIEVLAAAPVLSASYPWLELPLRARPATVIYAQEFADAERGYEARSVRLDLAMIRHGFDFQGPVGVSRIRLKHEDRQKLLTLYHSNFTPNHPAEVTEEL